MLPPQRSQHSPNKRAAPLSLPQTLPGPSPVLTLAALPDGGFVAGTGGPEFAIKARY